MGINGSSGTLRACKLDKEMRMNIQKERHELLDKETEKRTETETEKETDKT